MLYVVIQKMNKIVHSISITISKKEFNITKSNKVIIIKNHLPKLLLLKLLQILLLILKYNLMMDLNFSCNISIILHLLIMYNLVVLTFLDLKGEHKYMDLSKM